VLMPCKLLVLSPTPIVWMNNHASLSRIGEGIMSVPAFVTAADNRR
jgi:hypothetical protein